MATHLLSSRVVDPWTSPASLDENIFPYILLGAVTETLLYGMHVILYIICFSLLWRRNRRVLQVSMLAAVTAMFCLSTADVAVSWNIVLRRTKILYSGNSDTTVLLHAIYPKFLLHLFNNLLADMLLMTRCYVVWGKRKFIIYLCGPLLISGTVFGILGEVTTAKSLKKLIIVYIVITIASNILVTLLTAARIMWIAREVKRVLGKDMVSQYHFAVGSLVESGFLYSASAILLVILSGTNFVLMAAAISIRVVAIAPILLVVQIALGQTTKPVQTIVSTLQMATTPVVLDTIITTGRYENENEIHERSRMDDSEDPATK